MIRHYQQWQQSRAHHTTTTIEEGHPRDASNVEGSITPDNVPRQPPAMQLDRLNRPTSRNGMLPIRINDRAREVGTTSEAEDSREVGDSAVTEAIVDALVSTSNECTITMRPI